MLGSIVHSLAFGDLEIIENGAIVYYFNEPKNAKHHKHDAHNGLIEAIYDFTKHPEARAHLLQEILPNHILDFTGKMIIPGFVDAHCHAPQYTFTGTGMDLPLLAWLEKYTFPSEAKFEDLKFAKLAYEKSVKRHLKHGSTTASYFGTLHLSASKILTEVIEHVGQRAFVGKVSMDRNAPEFYVEKTENALKDAEEFVHFVLSRCDTGRHFLHHLTHTPNTLFTDEQDEEENMSTSEDNTAKNTDSIDAINEEDLYPSLLENVDILGKRALQLEEEEMKRCRKRPRAMTDASFSDITSANLKYALLPDNSDNIDNMASNNIVYVNNNYNNIFNKANNNNPVGNIDASAAVQKSSVLSFSTSSASPSTSFTPPPIRVYQSLLNRADTPLIMPVITPRFVPTCSAILMTGLSQLALKYGLPIQSHMSESVGEIQWVQDLHPECQGLYVDVYRRYGLIGAPLTTYMAHCVHSDAHEIAVMRRCHTGAVHCASSNFMLSSGIMDVRHFMEEGVKVAVGTDVAGGYSPSMLDALRQTIIASRAKGFQLSYMNDKKDKNKSVSFSENDDEQGLKLSSGASSPLSDGSKNVGDTNEVTDNNNNNSSATVYRALNYAEAFHLCTVGGAAVLGMDKVIGNFLPGKKLDCLIVDVDAKDSPIDTFGTENTSERFQKFLFLGDDRNLSAIYVNGRKVM